MRYDVVYAGEGPLNGTPIDVDVLATPRLIDEGTRHVVMAYRENVTNHGQSIWRVQDNDYDAQHAAITRYFPVRLRVLTDDARLF